MMGAPRQRRDLSAHLLNVPRTPDTVNAAACQMKRDPR